MMNHLIVNITQSLGSTRRPLERARMFSEIGMLTMAQHSQYGMHVFIIPKKIRDCEVHNQLVQA